MKKFIFLFILFVSSVFADISWLDSYEQAKQKALKEKRYVMLMLSKEDCEACWYMQNIVFKDKKVQKLISDNFIAVHLDIYNDFIPEGFTYIGVPTFYFTYANGEKIADKITGASNIKDFTLKVNSVLDEVF